MLIRRKKRLVIALVLLAVAGAALLFAQFQGLLYIVDRVPAPNGAMTATVFERDVADPDIPGKKTHTTIVTFNGNLRGGGSHYPGAAYVGLWWSPDSSKYFLQLEPTEADGMSLELSDLERNTGSNMGAKIPRAMRDSALADYGFQLDEAETPVVELDFLQWRWDGAAFQLRYSFRDTSGACHSGTFWYLLERQELLPGEFSTTSGRIQDIQEDL